MKTRKIKTWFKDHKEAILKGAVLALSTVAGGLVVALIRSRQNDINYYDPCWIGFNDPEGNETNELTVGGEMFLRMSDVRNSNRDIMCTATIMERCTNKED